MKLSRSAAAIALPPMLACFLASAGVSAQEFGAIKALKHLPATIYDEDGNPTGESIGQRNAPPTAGVIVYGWFPDDKLLLVRLHPGDAGTVYISYYNAEMTDQSAWDERMAATGALVCLPSARAQRAPAQPPDYVAATTKGFQNPC
jgi:hypothetical protein